MNLGALLMGFVLIALTAGMIMYAGATESTQVVDSQGVVQGSVSNSTDQIVGSINVAGSTAAGYLVLIIAAIAIICATAIVVMYSRTS